MSSFLTTGLVYTRNQFTQDRLLAIPLKRAKYQLIGVASLQDSVWKFFCFRKLPLLSVSHPPFPLRLIPFTYPYAFHHLWFSYFPCLYAAMFPYKNAMHQNVSLPLIIFWKYYAPSTRLFFPWFLVFVDLFHSIYIQTACLTTMLTLICIWMVAFPSLR